MRRNLHRAAALAALTAALAAQRMQPKPVNSYVCGKTTTGQFKLQRITMRKRMRAKLHQVEDRLQLARQWLPTPRILHSYPEVHFAASTRGRSPVR